MEKLKPSGFLPAIIGLLVIVAGFAVFKVLPAYLESLKYEPKLEIQKNAPDTGVYLDSSEYFSPEANIGKHFLLACKTQNNYSKYASDKNASEGSQTQMPEKTDDGYLYYFVENIRNTELEYVLLTDEMMSGENYKEIDCLVTGSYRYTLIDSITEQRTTKTIPVLKLLKVKADNIRLMDYAAPLKTVDEPNHSVEEQGVILTLNKVEYRENICRVFLTLENKSEYTVVNTGLKAKQNSDIISGISILNKRAVNPSISKYYESQDETLFPFSISPKSKHNAVLVIEEINKDDKLLPVHFTLGLLFYTGKSPLPEIETSIDLEYMPHKQADCTPDSVN